MIVLRCEVERLPRMYHGPWHIAASQGQSGTGKGDRAWETAKCLVVHDDHRC
jgi:hypothetical protein